MSKRPNGLPQVPYPVPAAVDYIHHPGTPAGVVAGTPKNLSAPGQTPPRKSLSKDATDGLDPAGQRCWSTTLRLAATLHSPPQTGLVAVGS